VSASLERLWHFPSEGCDTRLHLQQRALPLTLAMFLVWLLLRPTSFALTGTVFAGSLLLISYGWARTLALQVSSQRALRYTAVQVGDELEEVLTLENRSLLPVICAEFIDHSMAPGHSIVAVRVGRARGTEAWRLHSTCVQRGIYHLGHWECRLCDPFGLFEVRQVYRRPLEITVYPPLATTPPAISQQRRTLGDRLVLRQALPAETVNAMTTRPYVQGEALRRVHWRTSARHEDLFVKSFEPEASSVMWLVPDLDAAVHMGTGNESSLEKMIMLTATLAWRLLDGQLAVGLVIDAAQTQVVRPQFGRAQLWPILRALAAARAGDMSLAESLNHARTIVSARDSAVILTPSTDPEWIRPLHGLAAGRRGGLEVLLLDPASFGSASSGAGLVSLLRSRGIPSQLLRRQDIQPARGRYGRIRRWEFKTLGTGRVIVQQQPRHPAPDAPWWVDAQ